MVPGSAPRGPGTLYAGLARPEERGLIEALPPTERRRPYRLTAACATVLTEHFNDLAERCTGAASEATRTRHDETIVEARGATGRVR